MIEIKAPYDTNFESFIKIFVAGSISGKGGFKTQQKEHNLINRLRGNLDI